MKKAPSPTLIPTTPALDTALVERFLLAGVVGKHASQLGPKVKEMLTAAGAGKLETQYGSAVLQAYTEQSVDTAAFIRRCRDMQISEKRQFAALSVVKKNAPWISPDDWSRLSEASAGVRLVPAATVELLEAAARLAELLRA